MENEKEAEEYAEGVLNVTAAELSRAVETAKPARLGEILENIVLDGMFATMNQIKKERDK